MDAMTCVVCGNDPVMRVPIPDRNRILRSDGTPVFLCPDCDHLARAGQFGAFSNGSLLRLRDFAPLFGIDLPAEMPRPHRRPSRKQRQVPAPPATQPAPGGILPRRHALGHG